MRLLETTDLQLCEFPQNQIPRYAILSHTWTEEEISYDSFVATQAFKKKRRNNETLQGRGWQKILGLCRRALQDGYKYAWIDTCCIDKRSSAELSEAINSMFRWYSRADVCYVYLEDFQHDIDPFDFLRSNEGPLKYIPSSRWFSRGWTLQELLAPQRVIFFSASWKVLGDRTSLAELLSHATKIPLKILDGSISLFSKSIAQRMSWASNRQTTREEDMAYCLMGLFDVNMPMLYGEGQKAFFRLQEEILKASNDHTLFAWGFFPDDPERTGLLAPHPRNFRQSADIEDRSQLEVFSSSNQMVSGRGVSISTFLSAHPSDSPQHTKHEIFELFLKCTKGDRSDRFVVVDVQSSKKNGTEFFRYHCHDPESDVDANLRLSRLKGLETEIFVPLITTRAHVYGFGTDNKMIRVHFSTDCYMRDLQIRRRSDCMERIELVAERSQFFTSRPLESPSVLHKQTNSSNPEFTIPINSEQIGNSNTPPEIHLAYRLKGFSRNRYALPWLPRTEILGIYFQVYDKFVRIHLGIDEWGQIGHSIHISGILEPSAAFTDSAPEATKKHNYKSARTMITLTESESSETLYIISVEAPNVEQIQPGQSGVVTLSMIAPSVLPNLPELKGSGSLLNLPNLPELHDSELLRPPYELGITEPKRWPKSVIGVASDFDQLGRLDALKASIHLDQSTVNIEEHPQLMPLTPLTTDREIGAVAMHQPEAIIREPSDFTLLSQFSNTLRALFK